MAWAFETCTTQMERYSGDLIGHAGRFRRALSSTVLSGRYSDDEDDPGIDGWVLTQKVTTASSAFVLIEANLKENYAHLTHVLDESPLYNSLHEVILNEVISEEWQELVSAEVFKCFIVGSTLAGRGNPMMSAPRLSFNGRSTSFEIIVTAFRAFAWAVRSLNGQNDIDAKLEAKIEAVLRRIIIHKRIPANAFAVMQEMCNHISCIETRMHSIRDLYVAIQNLVVTKHGKQKPAKAYSPTSKAKTPKGHKQPSKRSKRSKAALTPAQENKTV